MPPVRFLNQAVPGKSSPPSCWISSCLHLTPEVRVNFCGLADQVAEHGQGNRGGGRCTSGESGLRHDPDGKLARPHILPGRTTDRGRTAWPDRGATGCPRFRRHIGLALMDGKRNGECSPDETPPCRLCRSAWRPAVIGGSGQARTHAVPWGVLVGRYPEKFLLPTHHLVL